MEKDHEIGEIVYQVEGEWIDGRPIDDLEGIYINQDDATSAASDGLARFSETERSRIRSIWVREYEIVELDETASDGIGSMQSRGRGSQVTI